MNLVPSHETAAIGHHEYRGTWLAGESRRDELERILERQSGEDLGRGVAGSTENNVALPFSGGHIVHKNLGVPDDQSLPGDDRFQPFKLKIDRQASVGFRPPPRATSKRESGC